MVVRWHLVETSEGMAAAVVVAGNQTSDVQSTRASFDTNMLIILAALLCALIFALGLKSLVRCVLRCNRSEGGSAVRTGLKKSVLRKIPIIVYGSDGDVSGSGIKSGSECPICLGEFVDGEKVRVLPRCNHGFHVRCIDTWLGSHSSCPNCRHSLNDVAVGSSKAAVAAVGPNDGGGLLAVMAVEPPQEGGGDRGGGGGGEGHVVVGVIVGS